MFRRIVVGADGGPEGLDAVVLGATIADATGCGLTLLEATAPFLISSPGVMSQEAQLKEARRRLSSARDRYAPQAHIEVVADTNAGRALRAHAEHWKADLVVIGSSRRAPDGRCAIGRTGRRLLDEMPAALAIARRGLHQQPGALASIAVGYDGGTESERALQLADELAAATGAELLIDTVYEVPIPALALGEPDMREAIEELREDQRRGALAVAERAVARTSPHSRLDVCVGEPGAELRRASEDVDLMVIGSRRWGPFARIILGGVGETLVGDCGSSLIVTRKAPRPASTSETGEAERQTAEAD